MLPITERIVAELDVLYGLYLLAMDHVRKLEAEDEGAAIKLLDARDKVLDRTAKAAEEASRLLRIFETAHNVPAGERALVEEKRRMILDVVRRLQQADSQVMRAMHFRFSALRRELARHTERREAIRAYITAPAA
jgi:hypothetical protein